MSRHLGDAQSACWELSNPILGPRGRPWGLQGRRSLRHFLEKKAVSCVFSWGNLSSQLHSHPPWEPAGQASSPGSRGPGHTGDPEQQGPRAGLLVGSRGPEPPATQRHRLRLSQEESVRPEGLCGGLCCRRDVGTAGRPPRRAPSPEEGHRGPKVLNLSVHRRNLLEGLLNPDCRAPPPGCLMTQRALPGWPLAFVSSLGEGVAMLLDPLGWRALRPCPWVWGARVEPGAGPGGEQGRPTGQGPPHCWVGGSREMSEGSRSEAAAVKTQEPLPPF